MFRVISNLYIRPLVRLRVQCLYYNDDFIMNNERRCGGGAERLRRRMSPTRHGLAPRDGVGIYFNCLGI